MTREEAIQKRDIIVTQIINELGVTIETNTKPLIRCKDCKHWYNDADTGMACEFTNMGQPEDGYCNWGERKGGEDE